MKIYVSQIYIEVGASYPFSHHFQRLLSNELTECVTPSDEFIRQYAEDFDLMFRMSAKKDLAQPEVKGPTVFKRDKDVEFTIFLPFNGGATDPLDSYRQALRLLIQQIIHVAESLQMDVTLLSQRSEEMIERIISDPKMIE